VLVNKNSPRLNSQTNIFASILYSISEVDINTVIVDGKIIVKDRKLLTIALHGLLKEVNNTAKRLIQKPYGKPIQTFG
jgi:5-methylthioadenosine/S-adenosylhomocysteine deaminase